MYVNYERYTRFILLPSTLLAMIVFLLLFTILRSLMSTLGLFSILLYCIPLFIQLIALMYPKIVTSRIRKEIEDNIHFYITHMGALATSEVSRKEMMKILSERKEYKALAEETRKIYLLMDKWNKNLAQACRFLARRTPSKIFADFLDRMAHELDSGEDFKEFIKREQENVMDAFANVYQSKLYSIDVFKEVYISLVLSLSFFTAFAIIAPFLAGISVRFMLMLMLLLFTVIEVTILFYLKTVVPVDPIWQTSGEMTSTDWKLYKWFYVSCVLCLVVFAITLFSVYVFRVVNIPLPFIISLSITPLIIPGMLAKKEEMVIKNKDKNAPSFTMSLGASASARGGNILESLKFLTAHDFGALTQDIVALYKRLSTRLNKRRAWEKFSINTNSNLIYRFIDMFVEALMLGSDPKEAAEIVSKNFSRINSLRERRDRTASTFVGICYGAIIGIAVALYISFGVVTVMSKMFSTLNISGRYLQGILHAVSTTDLVYINFVVLLILFLHSIIAAIAIKLVDGGRWMSGFVHLVGMIWTAAVSGYVSQLAILYLMGGFG